MLPITTCQICARNIKSSKGLIAHHGYTRPDSGWQTASCSGARYEPYEVSCDRLREIIEVVKSFIVRQDEELKEFIATPPQTLTVIEKRGSYGTEKVMTYEKPEDFNAERSAKMSRTYASAYDAKYWNYIGTIKAAKSDLTSMEIRLANWQSPVVVVAE